jgi:hypothetical protein
MPQTWPMPYGPPPRDPAHPKRSRTKEPRPDEPRSEGSRPEAVRVTVDLTPDDYQLLNLWLARASIQLDQPVSRMTVARGIKAMIQASASDQVVNDVVLDVLRRDGV